MDLIRWLITEILGFAKGFKDEGFVKPFGIENGSTIVNWAVDKVSTSLSSLVILIPRNNALSSKYLDSGNIYSACDSTNLVTAVMTSPPKFEGIVVTSSPPEFEVTALTSSPPEFDFASPAVMLGLAGIDDDKLSDELLDEPFGVGAVFWDEAFWGEDLSVDVWSKGERAGTLFAFFDFGVLARLGWLWEAAALATEGGFNGVARNFGANLLKRSVSVMRGNTRGRSFFEKSVVDLDFVNVLRGAYLI